MAKELSGWWFKLQPYQGRKSPLEFEKQFYNANEARAFARDCLRENFPYYNEIRGWRIPTDTPMAEVHYVGWITNRSRYMKISSMRSLK